MMGGNCADLKPAKGRSEPTNRRQRPLSRYRPSSLAPAERAGTRSVGGVYQNCVHGIILSGELCSIHPCGVTYHGLYRTRPSPRAWPLTPFRPSRTCPPRSLASRERGEGGRQGGGFTRKEGEEREGRIKKGDLHQGESERRVANPVLCLRPTAFPPSFKPSFLPFGLSFCRKGARERE